MADDLIEQLKEAQRTRNDRVQQCEAELAKAKAERDQYALGIAEALGIIRPGVKANAKVKARRDRVAELLNAGRSILEIVGELNSNRPVIDHDIKVLRRQNRIADRIQPAARPAESAPAEDDDAAEEPRDEASPAPANHESGEKGSSKEALLAEVARQQGGIRGKVVILATTMAKHHKHTVRVDRMGDGHTTPDGSGHVHRCYRFVLSVSQGHTHDVAISKG